MKKICLTLAAIVITLSSALAQKYAYVDTEYILENIPSYISAQNQLDQVSQQYQRELEGMKTELDKMYKDYQAEAVLLSDDLKRKREDMIIAKEKEFKELQRQYFGPEGDLYQKRASLVQPIQDDVFTAVQSIANQEGYAIIFDKASSATMLYTDPSYDLSDQVLQKLGYKN